MDFILRSLVKHFPAFLHASLTGAIVIVFVIIVRLMLKRVPKIFSYALWGIVLLRLLVPVSIESPVSIVPEPVDVTQIREANNVLPEFSFEPQQEQTDAGSHEVLSSSETPTAQPVKRIDAQTYLTVIWLTGIAFMLAGSTLSYWKLRRRIRVSVPFRKGIMMADDIDTPFVMGLLRPVVYIPGNLDKDARKYVIAHERHHIHRGDHIFKALGFLALAVHWFNPLVWVAFVLAGRDMEMSCDEAVVRRYGAAIRADYSASLLDLASGRRIFSMTPLAFGEGDPTRRVRNLARWNKPSVWMTVLCIAVCLVLAVCLLTDRTTDGPEISETKAPELQTVTPVATTPPEFNDWGITIKPDRVSRTGATALFVYSGDVPLEEGAELTYGDLLTLERLDENERWVPVDELPGFSYYVGDSSYPVVDGYGMVHEWPDRFGELPDGHYRIGKLVTKTLPDRSTEEQMVYGEFTLPDAIRTGPIPLNELPERYSSEQAMIDGCFISEDAIARSNQDYFRNFANDARYGLPGFIRLYNCHYGDGFQWSASDLQYDGNIYTLTCYSDDEGFHTYTFRYLKHFTGEKAWVDAPHDAYEYYILVNDDSVSFDDIMSGKLDMSDWKNPAHWTVFAEFTYLPDRPQLPEGPVKAELLFESKVLCATVVPDRLEKIWLLFQEAEFLGYEPKTHSIGIGLELILTGQNGQTMTIELDPDNDICRINGEFVFYGAFDEPNYVEKLWYYLGIDAWPDKVYEKYPYTYRASVSYSPPA